MLLIGISGSGKSTLTRFVSWLNGASVFQPIMHSKYSISDFEEDLKVVLRRAGGKGEKICLLLDESDILDPSFLERINTLLANSEIPGLFDGEDYTTLLGSCKESAARDGIMLDSYDEIYSWFNKQVAQNLHVVFTMNPPGDDISAKATSSPALFNRCVLNWMGNWDNQAFFQVGSEFSSSADLTQSYSAPLTYRPLFANIFSPFSLHDVILDLMIFIHSSSSNQISLVKKSQHRSIFLTPRHYLDFVSNFMILYEEKRSQLEERQRHVVVGLDRLLETVTKVEELRKSLAIKRSVLETKSAEANEKLKKMVDDQQNAENKRAISMSMKKSLAEKNSQIDLRKKFVTDELAQAEPAVIEAQESVSSIKKQHLTEVRSMGNPPNAVKMAMESVCTFLGHKISDWKGVQAILRRDDFISSIVNYDTSKLSQSIRNEITNTYLMDPNYTFEIVNRASKACGPLVNWVIAQVGYASILEKVEPLRDELLQLEQSASATAAEAEQVDDMIIKLEKSINIYKDEYAVLISDVQSLKKEMESVSEKVDRSLRVLKNLSSERERWGISRDTFGAQMETLIGDSILAAAFISYAGIFDQSYRMSTFRIWKEHMNASGIKFQSSISIAQYLSTEEERQRWVENYLPPDDICSENAVMIQRAQRYPLIIDPSNQSIMFLKTFFKNQNLTVTSFRDPSFLKNLESALRFGNYILIQDAEAFDSIINPILNREIRKSGGRQLCRLGTKEIDVSPNFKLFLMTKNHMQHFSADISSRVTFVNFTITPESLGLQCLDKFLKAERPDIDSKRKDLLRMQGEFQIRLLYLEKALLDALNESTGNILDDENVLNTLETLKREATEIGNKVAETDQIFLEVEEVTSQYEILADNAASIYFCIQQMSSIEFFYQFSLEQFFLVFDNVLGKKFSQRDRLASLENDLFIDQFKGVMMGMRDDDSILLALLLAQIREREKKGKPVWTAFLENDDGSTLSDPLGLVSIFGKAIAGRLYSLSHLDHFKSLLAVLVEKSKLWLELLSHHQPEVLVTTLLSNSKGMLLLISC